jgi:hypothetical protein
MFHCLPRPRKRGALHGRGVSEVGRTKRLVRRMARLGHVVPLKDSSALFEKRSDSLAMAERVEMCRRTVVVDGKVYSVRRQSDSVFLLRLNDLAVRYVVVTADSIDFHGFERFVWPEAADKISSFEKLDDAAAYYQKITGSSKD